VHSVKKAVFLCSLNECYYQLNTSCGFGNPTKMTYHLSLGIIKNGKHITFFAIAAKQQKRWSSSH